LDRMSEYPGKSKEDDVERKISQRQKLSDYRSDWDRDNSKEFDRSVRRARVFAYPSAPDKYDYSSQNLPDDLVAKYKATNDKRDRIYQKKVQTWNDRFKN